jgi:hypothetical protein
MAGDDLAVLVDLLRRDRRRHPYQGRREYSQTARTVAEACERLISSGHATQAAPVLRKAVDRMTRALMYMDDSSGIVGDDLREMMNLYARACAAAPPKPAALANWLVTLSCDGPGWPRIMLRDFAGALGERGLAEVARLVEARAQAADPQSWTATFAVRDLREQLADVSGDVDRYVTVLSEHLDSAVQYERITRVLLDAGRRPEAIVWAQRGLADKPGWPHTERLRDTLVDLLLADGRPDAAVQVRRTEFARHPTATAYRALAGTSTAVGTDNPELWALTILEERVAKQPAYAGELLDVLLSLGHHEDAWEIGQSHRAQLGDQRWLKLLEQRRIRHPADVITPYQDMIERHILNSSDKQRYRRAVALLSALSNAYTAAGDPIAFSAYLTDLRVRHARRPAFIKTLDAADS